MDKDQQASLVRDLCREYPFSAAEAYHTGELLEWREDMMRVAFRLARVQVIDPSVVASSINALTRSDDMKIPKKTLKRLRKGIEEADNFTAGVHAALQTSGQLHRKFWRGLHKTLGVPLGKDVRVDWKAGTYEIIDK